MSFFKAILLGFLVSSLPGPASMSIMSASSLGGREILKSIAALIVGDVFVFFACGLLYLSAAPLVQDLPLRAFAGVFLMTFAAFSFLRVPKLKKVESTYRQTFILTFSSPGVWMANFALVALAEASGLSQMFQYFVGLQLGVALWFILLCAWLRRRSLSQQEIIRKACLGLMFSVGVVSIFIGS